MQADELHFRIHRKSKLIEVLNWKEFQTENDFLELIEDYCFWSMLQKSDVWDYVSEEEVFTHHALQS